MIARSVMALMGREYSLEQRQASIGPLFGVDRQIIEDGTYYVVEHAGRLVGSGGWSFRRTLFGGDGVANRDDFRVTPGVDPAHIRAFYIDPSAARTRDRHADPFAKRDRCGGAWVLPLRDDGHSDRKCRFTHGTAITPAASSCSPCLEGLGFPAHPYGKKPQTIVREPTAIVGHGSKQSIPRAKTAAAAFTAGLSTGIISHHGDGLVLPPDAFGPEAGDRCRRTNTCATTCGPFTELRADGGVRAAVRLPGMRRACPPCPPDRAGLPQHVGRQGVRPAPSTSASPTDCTTQEARTGPDAVAA